VTDTETDTGGENLVGSVRQYANPPNLLAPGVDVKFLPAPVPWLFLLPDAIQRHLRKHGDTERDRKHVQQRPNLVPGSGQATRDVDRERDVDSRNLLFLPGR